MTQPSQQGGWLIKAALYTCLPALLVFGLVIAIGLGLGHEVPDMTRDMAALTAVHPMLGMLSTLGMLLWTAAAVICLFAALQVSRRGEREAFWFLLAGFLLSAYLLLDDLFLIHESLAYLYLGFDTRRVYAFIALATLAYLWRFRRLILAINPWLLGLSLGLLGVSAFIDAGLEDWLLARWGQWEYLLEDGAKWLGIACWLGFQWQAAFRLAMGRSVASGQGGSRDNQRERSEAERRLAA